MPNFTVPGYNSPVGGWKEELIKGIDHPPCRVLPIISNSVCNDLAFGGHAALYQYLLKKIDYPLNQADDLIHRLQYVSVISRASGGSRSATHEGYLAFLAGMLAETAGKQWQELKKEIDFSSMSLSEKATRVGHPVYDPTNPLVRLAGLPLTIFVTTSYHSFLEVALKEEGKEPQTHICCWNQQLRDIYSQQRLDTAFEPTVKRPLVFHLHGIDRYPESLVLTEDDYFDFIAAVMADKKLIPGQIREALSNWSLVLLGYDLWGWDFKVLFRSIVKPTDTVLRKKSVSIQLEHENHHIKSYIEKYLGLDTEFEVYWGKVDKFMEELWSSWIEASTAYNGNFANEVGDPSS